MKSQRSPPLTSKKLIKNKMKTTPIWLFDLDNTLHRADYGIFQLINRKMTEYLATHLHLDFQAASDLREHYWHQYGATLAGLQKHYPHIDIMDFLRQSHPENEVKAALVAEINLPQNLAQLDGTKVIFSNAPSFYVQIVLNELSLTPYFDKVFACDDFGLRYKPTPSSYQFVCQELKVQVNQCIMVDDSAANLRPAHDMGMTTVWFGQTTHNLPFVDFAVKDMADLVKLWHLMDDNDLKQQADNTLKNNKNIQELI